MRRAAKVDANQSSIVKALRAMGACVILTAQLKNAFDILVIFDGRYFLMEIKDGTKPKSARKLTEGEEKCKACVERAKGLYHVVKSLDEAIKIIQA
jgi:hypothetical protein